MPEARINTGFRHFNPLFKLNRSRWFAGQIVEYSVYAPHLVDDTAHYGLEDVKRNFGGFCCHEVNGVDGTKGYGVVVGLSSPMTPTERIFVRAAKYWPIERSRPALAISSR